MWWKENYTSIPPFKKVSEKWFTPRAKSKCIGVTHTHTQSTRKRLRTLYVVGKEWIANEKDQRKSLLSNVGKIQSQMSKVVIYVKETRNTHNNNNGVSATKEVSK